MPPGKIDSFVVRGRPSAGWSTSVFVGRSLLGRAARTIARAAEGRAVVVVSDARVARLVSRAFVTELERTRARVFLFTFPHGERSKTRETKARLEDRLAARGIGRDTLLVAVGGGVTGDLAGFLAASWYRGVPVVQVPTTLVAMVDAALGGKTAVDLPGGKNLVGAFHHPHALWADIAVLRSLPQRELRAGFAEAIKIAVAADTRLFSRLERDAERLIARDENALADLIARCLSLKGRIVAKDERDDGPRLALNFGHTAAHAIEGASRYRVPHGEAVSVGMVVEARIAERLVGFPPGATGRLVALISRFGLPVRLPPGVTPRSLVPFARCDKKNRGGVLRCALPIGIGRMAGDADPSWPVDLERDFLPAFRVN